jgi:hypothetical protein
MSMRTFLHLECFFGRLAVLGLILCALASPVVAGFRADFDGDGVSDEATYHARTGQWEIHSGATETTDWYQFGSSATMPVPGDYDGDGQADLAVYEFDQGNWFVWSSLRDTIDVWQWGYPGVLPLPDDLDGDGVTELVVYDPASGVTYVRPEPSSLAAPIRSVFSTLTPGDVSVVVSPVERPSVEQQTVSPPLAGVLPPAILGPARRLVVLGDSLALGAGASSPSASWADGVALALHSEEALTYYNFSIGGSDSGDVLGEQAAVYSPLWFLSNPLLPAEGPTLVLATLGGNDLEILP